MKGCMSVAFIGDFVFVYFTGRCGLLMRGWVLGGEREERERGERKEGKC